MLMVLQKLGEPLANPYFHVQAEFMLMVLRKLGEPLANPCPCTGSFHADGGAEAWRAACKSLCSCTGSVNADGAAKVWQAACKSLCSCTGSLHADGAAEAWRAAGKASDATAVPASHQQSPVMRHGCALLHDGCTEVSLYFSSFVREKNTTFIAFKWFKDH
jgi:hypothetical protein